MKDGLVDMSDSELTEIWRNKNNSKYSKEFIESIRQEMLSRGLTLNQEVLNPDLAWLNKGEKNKKIPVKYTIYGLVCMSLFTFWIMYDVGIGQIFTRYGHTIYRDKDPVGFWITTSIWILVDVLGILQLLGKLL